MPSEPPIAFRPSVVAAEHVRHIPCAPSRRRAVVLTLLSIAILRGSAGHARGYDGNSALVGTDDRRSRGTWAALLLGYVALGALATGGAYLLRNDILGRSIAVSSAGWGGLGLGAGAGYGLVHLGGCGSGECSTEEQVAVCSGGLLGALAATIVGHLVTSDPGMSRPYTTALGVTPVLVFLMVGTIADW